jgi:hypothetical protein
MTETNSSKPNLDNINNIFKIPICYNKKVKKLNETIVSDLELIKSSEKEETPIYHNVFNPVSRPAVKIVEQFANYYTTDIDYLKESQTVIKSINNDDLNTIYNKYELYDYDMHLNETVSLWEEIKGETGFREKYLYIDWSFAKDLNNNPSFLQIMSIYNIASPILSLCLPIFVLIVPFFIIKLRGIQLNIKEYIDILKLLISNHAIFKVFTQFHQVDTGQKIYMVISAAFYMFSIYQNILVCVRFYSNMKKIHTYLSQFKKYLGFTKEIMNYHISNTNTLTNYTEFNNDLKDKIGTIEELYNKIHKISPFTVSLKKMSEIGHIMHTFYQIYDNEVYNEAFLYSFGFHGYFRMICRLANNVNENKMAMTQFSKKDIMAEIETETEIETKSETETKTKSETNKQIKNKKHKDNHNKPIFKKMYYPKFIDEPNEKIVKNDCSLNKNLIITGPNASGKTTTLKTAAINIILSQQFGFGCFESLTLTTPFDHFHCYLNIPDTSGRDSLFQAEARRCKEIIDCLNNETNNNNNHFCIFDELYSGTNPEEAVVSASAFLQYIVNKPNVTCLLTTHYIAICKKLIKNKNIQNFSMKVIKENDNFQYTYLIQKGISKIKGGLKVLHDMNYPKEILNNI